MSVDQLTRSAEITEIRSEGRAKDKKSPFLAFGWTLSSFVVALIAAPLAVTIARLFFPGGAFNTEAFTRILNKPWLNKVLLDTAILLAVSTIGALVVATFFAWLSERTNARMGWLSDSLPVFPLFVPSMASAVGWVMLATPGPGLLNGAIRGAISAVGFTPPTEGPLNIYSWPGVVFLYIITLVPFCYLPISAALRNVNPALEEASRVSGSGLLRTCFKVTLPALRPSLLSGLLLALAAGFAVS